MPCDIDDKKKMPMTKSKGPKGSVKAELKNKIAKMYSSMKKSK